jgi:serine/threonine-protein kinase RsbW
MSKISETRSFPGRFSSLNAINQFVTRAARDAGLDDQALYAVQMAVDEACANIIEHAYASEGRGPIECTCRVTDQGLTVVLHDHGQPFDPTRVVKPDLNASLRERSSGGLGVYFIRQLMDDVRYEFSPQAGNTLTMVKHKETAA